MSDIGEINNQADNTWPPGHSPVLSLDVSKNLDYFMLPWRFPFWHYCNVIQSSCNSTETTRLPPNFLLFSQRLSAFDLWPADLGGALDGEVEAWASEEEEDLLPGLAAALLHMQEALDLWTRSRHVLGKGKMLAKISTTEQCGQSTMSGSFSLGVISLQEERVYLCLYVMFLPFIILTVALWDLLQM